MQNKRNGEKKAMTKGNNQLKTHSTQNQSQSQSQGQQIGQAPAVPQRPQQGLPGRAFFGATPGRGPPSAAYNDLHNRPSLRFTGYGPPRLNPPPQHPAYQPFSAQGQELMLHQDDRDSRFDRTTAAFQRPRASSYVHYSQQIPPPAYPQPGGPPPPHVVHPSHGDDRFDSLSSTQGLELPTQRPPPYGPTYPIARSQSWTNPERPYHNGGPYTSAQRNNTDGRSDNETHNEEAGPFSMIGSSGPTPAIQQPSQMLKKQPYAYNQSQVHSSILSHTVDADAIAYKAVEGRDGVTSPSQIDSNRREDVSVMGCTCKKTKCLKLYCVCFGASVMCGVSCRCLTCNNTPSHEQARKDAIRTILARNPSAFDAKFKKAPETRAVQQPTEKAIAHKLGCKCRKSFCTKKYCECYNAGVKCSSNCRCVGCKNMPPGGFGNGNSDNSMASLPFMSEIPRFKATSGNVEAPPATSENRERDAATHLAFLKHSSPARPVRRHSLEASRVVSSSIPSLTDSSSGTMSSSPDEDSDKKISVPPCNTSIGVNSLLLAAYAMTELHESASAPATPQKAKHSSTFRSPKRKSHPTPLQDQFDNADEAECSEESDDADSDNIDVNGSALMTPECLRHVKRTRVGTVERKAPLTASLPLNIDPKLRPEKPPSDSEEDELSDDDKSHPSPEDSLQRTTLATTPKTSSKPVTNSGLTPVSARCIDFQHMGMGESANVDEKKKGDMACV